MIKLRKRGTGSNLVDTGRDAEHGCTHDPESSLYCAERRVLEIQTKLHRRANDDLHRRFDDLFNLVTDPAFLLVAWDRVRKRVGDKRVLALVRAFLKPGILTEDGTLADTSAGTPQGGLGEASHNPL